MKYKKLVITVVLALAAGMAISAPRLKAQDNVRSIAIHAKRFEFVPNLITLKKGETVKLQLISDDVTHGFFLRPLKIDNDIEAGETTEITITPQTSGKFTTICDHFCGSGHGNMRMTIVVED